MIVSSGGADKELIVVWHCALEEGHADPWHLPRETRREITNNYELKPKADVPDLRAPEVLSVEWFDPDTLTRQSNIGKLWHDRLEPEGWVGKLGKSQWFKGDAYIKSTRTIKPGKVETVTWLSAVHPETHRTLHASVNGVTVNGIATEMEEI
jgi:hypothetical protein